MNYDHLWQFNNYFVEKTDDNIIIFNVIIHFIIYTLFLSQYLKFS